MKKHVNMVKKTELNEDTSEAVERINTNLKECTICTIIWGWRKVSGEQETRKESKERIPYSHCCLELMYH